MSGSVKYRDDADIWRAADSFRDSADLRGHHIPPIDVIYIAEIVLKLDIIPLPDLLAEQHIDAALLPDLSGFYIDEEAYMSWERGVQWIEQRLRFSFAHELGHFVLHKDEIAAKMFESVGEFRRWAIAPSPYGSAEYQANEFAGRFLVPRDILLSEYDQASRNLASAEPRWREIEGMRNFIAKKVAPRFGVNHQVIETRFDHEGIWPAE
ncbi:MAG TPA: ImmA/IrrE family metallo-endopeptidase [Verrucomicrobiae bacterium]|nr:ImmA/IrrE family metallo-endopeptidase [Verrucomicrobiae bacterium]